MNDDELVLDHATQTEQLLPYQIKVPILGYEIMEQRARFTVFKINVHRGENDSWCIFRRYTDFLRLNKKLSTLFPGCRFSLPPKRWFGDNFDPRFLEDRLQGLQVFINNLIGHHSVFNSDPVKQFFCFDAPPNSHDTIEESRAYCESLEETVYELKNDISEREETIKALNGELLISRSENKKLIKTINRLQQLIPPDKAATFDIGDADSENTSLSDMDSYEEASIKRTKPATPPTPHSWELSTDTYDTNVKLKCVPSEDN